MQIRGRVAARRQACLLCRVSSAEVGPCPHLGTMPHGSREDLYITKIVAGLSWSGLGPFGTFPSGARARMALAFSIGS